MVDSGKAIREILLLNSTVTSLLQMDQNSNPAIYVGNDLPEHFDPANGPAILISRRGGKSHDEITALADTRLQIKVAAAVEKYLLAFQVYQALFAVLQGINQMGLDSGTVLINRVLEVTAPQEMSDPDTGWCYVIGFWNVLATDVTAIGPAGGTYAPTSGVFATKGYVDAETTRAQSAEALALSGLNSTIVIADHQVGADWGAKVQAADTLLGANAGEIWVTPAAGLSAPEADITLNSKHTLRFIGGGWSQSQTWMLGTSRILIPQGAFAVGIKGSPGQGSWVQYSGTDFAVVIGASGSTQTTHVTIEDMNIGMRSTVDNAGCIKAICTEFLQINRCYLSGNPANKIYGILSDGSFPSGGFSAFTSIRDCLINVCFYAIKTTNGSGSLQVIGGFMGGVGKTAVGGIGLNIDSAGAGDCNNLFCCDVEGFETGIRIATSHNVLSCARFEQNGTDCLFDTGSASNKVYTFNPSNGGLVVTNNGAATNQFLYSDQNLALASSVTTEVTRAQTAEGLLVPKTTTVNGHALSSNVVVSASDLTTGTLPHAQLPTLVSGDIPAIPESSVTSLVSDLALKAPLASAALTGVPTAPTATPLTGTTQLATTAYDDAAVLVEKNRAVAAEALLAPKANPALTGTATAVTLKASKAITTGINAMGNVTGAALSIDLSLGNVITMTLTGNVTSSSFANAVAASGEDVTVIITQDGTGGRTFAWPSAVVPVGIAPVPSLAPNSVSVFKATIDGSGNANFTANGPVTVFRQKTTGVVASSSGSPTFTPPTAGNYRANVLIRCTTVGTTATMGLKISTNSGAVNSQGPVSNVACTAVGLQGGVSFPFYDDALSAAHAVSWFNTLTNAIGAAVYAVEFWIEYLGN